MPLKVCNQPVDTPPYRHKRGGHCNIDGRGPSLKRTKVVAAIGFILTGAIGVTPSNAHTSGIHDNCTKLHQRWPHGVGRRGAVDRGGNVTNFTRNTRAYNRAEAHNSDLDRDNDRIACEKA